MAVGSAHAKLEEVAEPASSESKWTLNNAVGYTSCFEFVSKTSSETSQSSGRLLFLRGFPSVEWLGLIGGEYRVDPEFFVRFLHFKPASDATVNHSLPALPAATWNILELPIVTIGERKVFHGLVNQAEINAMRREAASNLQKHHDSLRRNDGIIVASSLIRDVAIIDHSCFALEQRIWVCLQPENGRWTLIVWTDSGCTPSLRSIQDLKVLPQSFQTEATSLAPVIDYKPNTGLLARKYALQGYVNPVNGAEAASQLCVGYGRTLYTDIMATDPLYALTEVFNVNTASVNQYLNLIEDKLAGFSDDEHYADFDMLPNLRYTKDILYRQQRQIEQVIAWLKPHRIPSSVGWRTTEGTEPKASQAAQSVLQRYEYLQTRVKTLQAQCQDAISNLMNSINLKEVKNSYEQSQRVAKLSFLAFVFAPLSFTTSFFAMKINGLDGLSLKRWIIVTIILVIVVFFLMFFDILGWIKALYTRLRHKIKNARYL